jgi:hypothetical protein
MRRVVVVLQPARRERREARRATAVVHGRLCARASAVPSSTASTLSSSPLCF